MFAGTPSTVQASIIVPIVMSAVWLTSDVYANSQIVLFCEVLFSDAMESDLRIYEPVAERWFMDNKQVTNETLHNI